MSYMNILNRYLEEYNAAPVSGISYQQYDICETEGCYQVLEQTRLVASTDTLQQAKELIDSITSGC